jgi:hypothetical protein
MKSKFFNVITFIVSAFLTNGAVLGQTYDRVAEKTIRPVRGKTLVLKGSVRD